MAIFQDDKDYTYLEKQAGQKAARTLRRNLKSLLATATNNQTGLMLKIAGAGISMRFDSLEAVIIRASHVTFMQHYGFEGIKKNGVAMSMKAYDHFGNLFKSTKALETLANEIGDIRATKITNNIRF